QVVIDPAASARGFPGSARDQLVKILIGHFRANNFDSCLAEGLEFDEQTLQKNRTAGVRTESSALGAAGGTFGKVDDDSPRQTAANVQQSKPVIAPAENKAAPLPSTVQPTKAQVGFDPMWIVCGLAALVGLWLVIGI